MNNSMQWLLLTMFATAATASQEVMDWRTKLNTLDHIPTAFVRFEVPGHQEDVDTVRALFYHHYIALAGSTMWDEWLQFSLLWPDVAGDPRPAQYRHAFREVLKNRFIDPQGYVHTHQHIGLAHPYGWPFPLWSQADGVGWHFSLKGIFWGPELNIYPTQSTEGFDLSGMTVGDITEDNGLTLTITEDHASFTPPPVSVKGILSPFFALHWRLEGLTDQMVFYLDYTTEQKPNWTLENRIYFTPQWHQDGLYQTPVELYTHNIRQDTTLTRFRIGVENAKGLRIGLLRLFTAVDTRHQINNFAFIRGCYDYTRWRGDLNFLREQINRMRIALRYALNEFQVESRGCVFVPWWGHDGTSGIVYDKDGNKQIRQGHGIGGNYYDLVPFGGEDAYATIWLYHALRDMAAIERVVSANPNWNIAGGALAFDPQKLDALAEKVRRTFAQKFWNKKTGRFVACIDRNGQSHDYGFVFVNLEAIHYGLATEKQAKTIYDWLTGKRIVKGDTSTGEDIYHWRFAPRTTTLRNLDYYVYSWYLPESISWGDQVQDGGGVLGWSYFDLMNRIKVLGPDNAWQRLKEIAGWFREVQAEGGYRSYYNQPGRGTLQGGNVPGGLGLDYEFVESVLLPQVMLYGFMGIEPQMDSLTINPQLPSEWPSLTIAGVNWQGYGMDITATQQGTLKIKVHQGNSKILTQKIKHNQKKIEIED